VTKTKGTVWDVQLTVKMRNGVSRRVTKRGFATRKEATAWRDAERRRIRATNAAGAKPMTVPEILDRFIKEGPLTGSSALTYRRQLDLYIKPLLNVRADTLTAPRLQKFADVMAKDLSSRGHDGAASVSLAVGAVRAALKWAERPDVGLLDFNPVGTSKINTPQRNGEGRRPLEPGEYQALISAARPGRRIAWQLIFESAIRDGEALALRWSDIDLDTGRVDITRIRTPESYYKLEVRRTKSGQARVSYISQALCADLRALRQERGASSRDHVIVGQRGAQRLSMGQLQKWWLHDSEQAGIQGRSIHSLRHTWATQALRNGVDVKVVQEVLGHASLDTTVRYVHASDDGKRMASNAVQNAVSLSVDTAKTASLHGRTKRIA